MKNGRIKLLALAGVIGVTVSGAIFAFSAKAEKLDATTEEIFAHADKVEALRLSYYAAGNPDPHDQRQRLRRDQRLCAAKSLTRSKQKVRAALACRAPYDSRAA